ncbi:MAG: 30S ribosomal protein S3 [Parcubacteria group bacterium GW2011_GWC1_43_11b]|uniref:Small ribosomal subunit protein uS3 n=3 Tax=root TaxID=1 RepID=A0A1G2QBM8_9BACT|nr:30S ribosomal protein S3 [uncultured organism]KKS77367.1 MAG: 30S ribosomal protein S3 [Parcubacteria group bacterium GW2011_GWB1_42_9]KKS87929.1 MAG: 30S ribosomal protein S3 [Parcubacteria group bacterium GW2011_GWC1_43_11b]KKT09751.1 MAG: 30S ribosomal protein S3 [Parcubacteria group bacterium GW2011_GWA1_43_21]OHA57965.1 MAG: 30S ribosomal protein S3 [Candidatus Vogelbacteria bacterium RIFOXYB1_FULL_42_16]OHA59723.1 MAG: 30S ribosomal protein S3 [Candidatus Vogelbacteria bacterium RIFOX
MTHRVHPYAHRLGIIRDWKSRWFGTLKGQYQEFLKTDVLLREFLEKRLRGMYVDTVEMERNQNIYRIIIKTARPGMVIGRSGEGSTKLKAEILAKIQKAKLTMPREVRVDIEEVKDPESHSAIVAYMIAEGLEKRLPFRRVMKQAMEKTMQSKGVLGIKVTLSGRLGGAEMGRVESLRLGQVPLQTLRADIDFAREKAYLSYGVVGVKVWIYRGEIFNDKAKN